VARGEIEAQTEEIKNLRRHLNMIITSRMQQPIPLEYLEHRAQSYHHDDDSSSLKNIHDNNNIFSWGSGIFNLIFPMGNGTTKAFNFETTEIIHV
jgi:hypothetical protein